VGGRSGAAWLALLAGLASVATIPIAVYVTRFSGSYDLLHAGFAIPIAIAFGIAAVGLARHSRRRSSLTLSGQRQPWPATAGRVLGILGLCLAASALIALGVYGLLEYVGSRD
jgi:peptidoglycan/LPS O-acetylase OafA/YrhL